MLHQKPRVEPRTRATIRARLRDGGAEQEACILDLSTRGLLLTAGLPPRKGEIIEVMVGEISLVGQVRWVRSRRFGVVLRERISVAALLAGDTEAVALKRTRAARGPGRSLVGALGVNGRSVGSIFQYGILGAAVVGAAVLVAGIAGEGLGSLRDVSAALAQGERHQVSAGFE